MRGRWTLHGRSAAYVQDDEHGAEAHDEAQSEDQDAARKEACAGRGNLLRCHRPAPCPIDLWRLDVSR